MGQTFGSFTKETERSADRTKDETIEQLQLIQQMLAVKLETETNKMRAAAIEDKHFPVATVVSKIEKHLIAAKKASDEEIERCLNEVFRTRFLGGFVNLASVAVNELLETTSAGEAERMESHIIFANNSVLRVDYYLYKYTFSSKGMRDKFRNAVCYVVQVGVMDLEKADIDQVRQELNKTLTTTNLENLRQSQKLHREVGGTCDLYSEITRRQIVFGGKPNKPKLAWESIVHLLLADSCQNWERTMDERFGSLKPVMETDKNRRKSTLSSEMEFHIGKYRPNVPPRWRVPVSLPQKLPDKKEREKNKKKEKLRRQRDRDKKAAWKEDD